MRTLTMLLGTTAVVAAVIVAATTPAQASTQGRSTLSAAAAPMTVAAGSGSADPTDAYLFAYFEGEQYGGEQIRFGLSRGNDALHWIDINKGDPVLTSTMGTTGLRDPFLMRSHDGTKFYLLATDLKIYPNGNFSTAQQNGSLNLEIWESADLVHWSAQREVKVSSDYAGNTWAPEAYWDDASQQYVVFWASALYPSTDTAGRSISTSYQRMMYATTSDFQTFSAPQVWTDVKRGAGLGMIDSDVIKEGDYYYRFTKDEAYMIPRLERSKSLSAAETGSLATTASDPAAGWQLVKEKVGQGLANQWGGTFTAGEGPTVFKANDGDTTTGGLPTWYLFMDQPSYHGGKGYVPFATHDLSDPNGWYSVAATSQLPTSPRHGTVLPVTQAEYDRLLQAYQPDQLVTGIDDVVVTTVAGTAGTLPATVTAHYADGSSRQTPATWPAVDAAVWQAPGVRTITANPIPGATASDTLTLVVGDGHPPVTTLTVPGGADVWHTGPVVVSATATDDSGVAMVRTELDGVGTDTAGGSATITVTGDGAHAVTASATDEYRTAGPAVAATVKIDGTAPLSRADFTAGSRALTLTAEDATSGVARIEYSLDGGAWGTYGGAVTVPGTVGSVAYRAVDDAGNVEATRQLAVPYQVTMSDTSTSVQLSTTRANAGRTDVGVTATVAAGSAPAAAGYVKVTVLHDGDTVFSALAGVRSGTASMSVPASALRTRGSYVVRTEFLGTATLNPSSGQAALTAVK